ncbi:MAG: hypothetical protein EI684_14145 [Candidatus Viridilinea halotolerans]|uniref:Uncharacterized protein n=1 Tax=Candidatus Viridilinea halotolerans TaxID=2491704 RepID=A0A426TX22_9CHLR|nr:MAG: hypothetical protein EI684_14145 [Candidatus Viridilinea halotolerans]
MNTTTVQSVVTAAQALSPTEQFEVIQMLTRVLQQRYAHTVSFSIAQTPSILLPATVRRTPPVTNLADFAAEFWPEDETADDINTYIAQQRAFDRIRDVPDQELL